ncbi:MAG: SIR2 family protein [Hyphomonas sp.]|nr:SIR2 family protein [Hyphomonas sp.]
MAGDVREQITEWLTGSDTCFLLGAGCSMCAGKPLIGKLTENVLNGVDEKLLQQFTGLKPSGDRPATIEDLINFLVRYRDILGTITTGDGHSITIDEIDSWLTAIKKKIVSEVADDWESSAHHARFLQRLRGPRNRGPRDIFSLNYDTLLEASLDELRFAYVDGFRGTNRAWFDAETFDEGSAEISYRIFKLHGSINWTRDASGHVRRGRNANEDAADEPVVVYPSEQKYLQTQYGVYETLIGRFRNRLRIAGVNNCLIVLGYSFNDEHINEAICDAVNANNSNLTVISFIGPEADRTKQDERLRAFSDRCDSRFNAFIGSGDTGRFIGHALDEDAAQAVLNAELWKFEKLVDFIAGEAP